ncbi:MarR family winged helix-turn-helix transcriptional regulator [Allostreptomyces psammosilenae]|uniref:DNA-binding MarR family transcriptional regulator n=1 Tax=Allostreptomyces psammosilenae TaxID=1892865 RepID=A0A852ZU34_9ACTN|nr:MarR family transcriptional regulator [Allostreptomyces psammosilenae]NYI05395.1 DNA-binding MarR family transcriptional regulator [Allostreptomyces psammosilenae]
MDQQDGPPRADAVDAIIEQWRREMPALDTLPMEVFGRIHRVSRAVGDAVARVYARHGIGRGEFDVLAALRRAGEPYELAPGRIAATLMLTSGGMTGRVDRLERSGLVERLPDPHDRRGLRVRLTEAGRAAVEEAAEEGLRVQHRMLAGVPRERLEHINGLLRELHAAVHDDAARDDAGGAVGGSR